MNTEICLRHKLVVEEIASNRADIAFRTISGEESCKDAVRQAFLAGFRLGTEYCKKEDPLTLAGIL